MENYMEPNYVNKSNFNTIKHSKEFKKKISSSKIELKVDRLKEIITEMKSCKDSINLLGKKKFAEISQFSDFNKSKQELISEADQIIKKINDLISDPKEFVLLQEIPELTSENLNRVKLVNTLSKFSTEGLAALAKKEDRLFRNNMHLDNKIAILDRLTQVPQEKLAVFLEEICKVFDDKTQTLSRCLIIDLFYEATPEKLATLSKYASKIAKLPLAKLSLSIIHTLDMSMLEDLMNIPENEQEIGFSAVAALLEHTQNSTANCQKQIELGSRIIYLRMEMIIIRKCGIS